MRIAICIWIALGCGCATAAAADEVPKREPRTIADCHKIANKIPRVDCYDAVTGREEVLRARDEERERAALAAGDRKPIKRVGGILGELWDFDKRAEETKYEIKQYHPNYVIAYGTNPFNSNPQTSETRIYADQPSNDPKGIKFQVSAKAWLFGRDDNAFGFWLAYTQQSWWQAFDAANSRPFRETDFQPEAIVALRPELFGWDNGARDLQWRLLNFGAIHQSNGQSGNASRSWNRVYAEAGFERDWSDDRQLALLARAWAPISEDTTDDDNPGITNYLGYGDLRAIYRRGNYLFTAMARGNLRTGKGAGQIALAFPLVGEAQARSFPFKGYVQLFTGYGEGLLDYNWRQTTVGIGFTLNDRK